MAASRRGRIDAIGAQISCAHLRARTNAREIFHTAAAARNESLLSRDGGLDKRRRTVTPLKFRPTLNWLLIFVPTAIALRFWPHGDTATAVFICSALGIVPAAGWIGRATEALAARMGEGPGALLNATFGNAAELIIAGIALSRGLTNV